MTEREELDQLIAEERHRAEEGKPQDPDTLRRKGILHAQLLEYDLALAAFDAAEEGVKDLGQPPDPRISLNRAAVFHQQLRSADSLKMLDAAEEQYTALGQPPHPAIAVNRGAALRDQGRYDEALAEYDKALRQEAEQGIPSHYVSHMNRAGTLVVLGRIDEAREAYETAKRIQEEQGQPIDPRISMGFSLLSEYKKDYEGALKYLDEAESQASERGMKPLPGVSVNRGNVLMKMGRRPEAMESYTDALWRYGRLGAEVPAFVRQQLSCILRPGSSGSSCAVPEVSSEMQVMQTEGIASGQNSPAPRSTAENEEAAAAPPPPASEPQPALTLLQAQPVSAAPAGMQQPVFFDQHSHACDAFLSHRRKDGGAYARLIKINFEMRGKHAFLDVDEKQPTRRFDERLLSAIERARSFVLILTPGALERCANEGDWLRREISHAISLGKNIVPVMMPEFRWPKAEELPEEIRPLTLCEGLSYSHDYFPAFMDMLIDWAVREESAAVA